MPQDDETERKSFVLLFNSAVKLVGEGAETLADLKALERKGAKILSCGTCLDNFGMKERLRAGHVSTMHEIVGIWSSAGRAVQI